MCIPKLLWHSQIRLNDTAVDEHKHNIMRGENMLEHRKPRDYKDQFLHNMLSVCLFHDMVSSILTPRCERRSVHVAVPVRFITCESFYHTTLRLLRLATMATRYQSVDEARSHQQGSLLGPSLSIVSSNIDGLTCAKQDLLAELCTRNNCDILCLQETHRGPSRNRPRMPGMTLTTERLHDQYGSIFVRNGLTVDNASVSENYNIDVLSIELMGIYVSSVYKPPIETFSLPNAVTDGRVNVVIGDFNSHSVTWGYVKTNEDGESVENWADAN